MHSFNQKSLLSLLALFLTSCFIIVTPVKAAPKLPKWGKVSKAETELKKVPYDQEAHAVVLAHTGHLSYLRGNFHVKKYVRIKILDSEGISEGNVAIPYYSGNRMEKIDNIKAQTLEILENGKIVKHSLDKKQVFDIKVNENWSEVRFALPAVKAGTIIEYSFDLYTENFYFLEGWVFQNDIPTLHSYFKAEVPDFLRYKLLMHGRRMVSKYQNAAPGYEWELKNLPALKNEPYTFNLLDYAEKISFQLTSYDKRDTYNNIKDEKVFVDWENISKEILSRQEFKSYLNSNKVIDEVLSLFPAEKDSLSYAKELYSYVQQTYSWNERYGLLPDHQLKEMLKSNAGNGTSINLLLVGMLQRAGFDAYPTYVSTKSHGMVSPEFPFLSQFNHVIGLVTINGKEYLLDAAGNKLAFGILPVQDLNYKALALSKKEPRWVEVRDQSKSSTLISYFADLAKGKHQFNCSWSGFEALQMAAKAKGYKEEMLLIPADPRLQQDSVHISNEITENNSLKASYFFSEKPDIKADKIYYSIPLYDFLKENPFNNEVRYLPVDFGYSSSRILIYNILIPNGYAIEEMPENLSMTTPGKEASFFYVVNQQGNILNIQIKMDIKESLIPVERYLYLRELYSKMINHCQKSYVLSKK